MPRTAALAVVVLLCLGGCATDFLSGRDGDKASGECEAIAQSRAEAEAAYETAGQDLRDFALRRSGSIRLTNDQFATSSSGTFDLVYARLVSGSSDDFAEFPRLQSQALTRARVSFRLVSDNPDCFSPTDVAKSREALSRTE